PALPKKKLTAMSKLAMGHVIRVTFSFSERFWDGMSFAGKTLSNMSFLLSRDEWFPTWWTRAPEKSPVITAWAPFPSADRLSGKSESFVVDKSLETLSRLLGVSKLGAHLNAAYVHDWQSDPWSRGAYSYVKVGGDRAEQDLGAPLNGALFFAGEATDIVGNNGTVNGAIASGKRVAKEITASSGHGT
ncbi:MAG TPA: FAD-dependent oxidoreductase, partial [Terriglobales bacterium]|nr:FAD-dependent oxidoreductase [Terriglobales bacterium]